LGGQNVAMANASSCYATLSCPAFIPPWSIVLESGNQFHGVGKHSWFPSEIGHGYGNMAFYLAFSPEMLFFWFEMVQFGSVGVPFWEEACVIPENILTSL
jgi:hypothetical protein